MALLYIFLPLHFCVQTIPSICKNISEADNMFFLFHFLCVFYFISYLFLIFTQNDNIHWMAVLDDTVDDNDDDDDSAFDISKQLLFFNLFLVSIMADGISVIYFWLWAGNKDFIKTYHFMTIKMMDLKIKSCHRKKW